MTEMFLTGEFSVRYLDGRLLEREGLHRLGERLMEALLALETPIDGVSGPSTASDARNGTITIDMAVELDGPKEAVATYYAIVHAALVAVDGTPPDPRSMSRAAIDFSPTALHLTVG